MILRDFWFIHFWSILDEIIELSWQHILPHFRECWWDHLIMDLGLSNTPAIFVGCYCVKLFGIESYDWFGKKGKKSVFEWDMFRCHRRFGGILIILIVICANFLCGFFLINNLWIPP
jgi:phosphatidylserine synthase 2